jgi:uncharacterized Rmd1/YagE family protein
MKTCIGHCDARTIDTAQLLINCELEVKKLREAIRIQDGDSEYYVFAYGPYIRWGQVSDVIEDEINKYSIIHEKNHNITDEFEVDIIESKHLIHEDIIFLPDNEENTRLSISHAIAQSLKLSQIEDDMVTIIEATSHIPQNLAKEGRIKDSRRSISKLRGELYLFKSKINLDFQLLDKPEFFWENPEYDDFYQKTSSYLELDQRIEILNKKLSVIDELLSILADELNHRHSSRLEWIIIWLIAVEIVIFFVHDYLKLI